MTAPSHLLILGVSRGGTTLLATALGAHPRIACLDEDLTGAFNRVVGDKIRGLKLCVPNHVELHRRWTPWCAPGLWFGATRKSLTMNKVPKSRLSIADLAGFGDTQCVAVLRDPRAVVGAIGRRENRSSRVAAYRWHRSVDVADGLSSLPGRPPLIVDFDRLVQNPETVLRGLCSGMDLEFTDALLNAPSLNRRYPGSGFDASRAGAAGSEDVDVSEWLSETTLSTYRRLKAQSL
ncbi:sulfotransferase [Rhodovibrio salinarum]|nr:sulfotransferase [Rhodovibrio salinarum]